MAEKNNSNCVVCGKGYHLCMSCRDMMNLHPWKVLTDTSEHYKIFQVLKGFNNGIYSKEDAKKALENIDLSDKDTFIEAVRNRIDAILADEKSINLAEEILTEKKDAAEEIGSEAKSTVTRKRKQNHSKEKTKFVGTE